MKPDRDIYQAAVRPLQRNFLLAAALLVGLAALCASQVKTRRSLELSYGELVRAREGLTRVREAIANRKKALAQLSPDEPTRGAVSPDRVIYGWVDEVKARLKPSEVAITALERKGDEVSLHYTLSFVNPGYSELLNAIGSLQQSAGLITPIDAVSLTQSQQNGKGVVAFTVKGTVLSPARNRP